MSPNPRLLVLTALFAATCSIAFAADPETPLTGKNGEIRGYKIARAGADVEKPAGERNTFTVICDKDSVTILVNGKEVNKATGTNLTSGFIGLQSEGGAFEVKQAMIEPL